MSEHTRQWRIELDTTQEGYHAPDFRTFLAENEVEVRVVSWENSYNGCMIVEYVAPKQVIQDICEVWYDDADLFEDAELLDNTIPLSLSVVEIGE